MTEHVDVCILGGGIAGLSLALHLKQRDTGLKIIVLEKAEFPVAEGAHKVGESTVEMSAHYFDRVLGAGEHLRSQQLRKLGLRCFFHSDATRRLDERLELGSNTFFPRTTFQLDRGRFENYLQSSCSELGVEVRAGTIVREVELSSQGEHAVSFESVNLQSDSLGTLSARWVVDASGRRALLRTKLGLERECEHKINATWLRVNARLNVDDWGSGQEWLGGNQGDRSRWFSTNHLMGPGYWVWIIPLACGATSIGLVSDPRFHPLEQVNSKEKLLEWLARHEPVCAEALRQHQHLFMDFHVLKHFSRRCSQLFSGDRWAITGDSGVFIDPLYSPGMDFIALANSLIVELIERDRGKQRIGGAAEIFNELFLSFADNTFLLYQDHYVTLGSPVVMPVKILWDFALYWSFTAFLFTQGKLWNLSLLSSVRESLRLLTQMNREMQTYFRSWAIAEQGVEVKRNFIDIARVSPFFALNQALVEKLEDSDVAIELERKLRELKLLAGEIVEGAVRRGIQIEIPAFLSESPELDTSGPRLTSVFERLEAKDVVAQQRYQANSSAGA